MRKKVRNKLRDPHGRGETHDKVNAMANVPVLWWVHMVVSMVVHAVVDAYYHCMHHLSPPLLLTVMN